MPKSKRKIIDDIKEYVGATGSPFAYWYIGVAERATDALFRTHGVNREGDLWIFKTARSSSVAHAVRDKFTNEFGMEGSHDAAAGDPTMVYAYRMAAHTEP